AGKRQSIYKQKREDERKKNQSVVATLMHCLFPHSLCLFTSPPPPPPPPPLSPLSLIC
ncbi:hypothetical protein A2U01_0054037, partial [Trifolium medium]|nr:hypothetical protein [Trifolium medium]